jgi:hypothetical protein
MRMALMTDLVPTLSASAVGRFDLEMSAGVIPLWYNLNNEGGSPRPRVTALDATKLVLDGGYKYDHFETGSGSGHVTIEFELTGPTTCFVGFALNGTIELKFANTGTYIADMSAGGDVVKVRYTLDDDSGTTIDQQTFGSSARWYPGVLFRIRGGTGFAFENMSQPSADLARDENPRNAPGTD